MYENTHTLKEVHTATHTKPQVYDRWRRLIASALHHEWQQEVMNALLYGGRGNEYVGYLSLCLKPFPVAHLYFHSPVTFLSSATLQHASPPLCFPFLLMYFYVFLHPCPCVTQSIRVFFFFSKNIKVRCVLVGGVMINIVSWDRMWIRN